MSITIEIDTSELDSLVDGLKKRLTPAQVDRVMSSVLRDTAEQTKNILKRAIGTLLRDAGRGWQSCRESKRYLWRLGCWLLYSYHRRAEIYRRRLFRYRRGARLGKSAQALPGKSAHCKGRTKHPAPADDQLRRTSTVPEPGAVAAIIQRRKR